MTLRDDLLDIRGVGDATADTILELVEAHEVESAVADDVRTAVDYFDTDQPHQAEEFVRRAYGRLD